MLINDRHFYYRRNPCDFLERGDKNVYEIKSPCLYPSSATVLVVRGLMLLNTLPLVAIPFNFSQVGYLLVN